MKKIIISDFDDTLFKNQKISNEDLNNIKEFRRNNIFVIATGSSLTSFLEKSSIYDLKYDYLIVNHGSSIIKQDKVIYNDLLDKDVINDLIKHYNLNDNFILSSSVRGNFFSSATKGLTYPNDNNITKVHLEFDDNNYNDEVSYLKENFKDRCNIYEILNHNDIEIISKNSSKLKAIENILDLEKIDSKFVYTIGDGKSDIEMIKKYNGYCVKNSILDVKECSIKVVNNISDLIKDVL